MTNTERAREFFKKDHFASDTTSIAIEHASKNEAICNLKIEEKHLNAVGTVMGGAIFTLADFAFAVAANFDNIHTVSLASSISFLSVAKGSVLTAKAKCIKDGRSSCVFAVDIFDDLGTNVAYVTINGFRMNNPVSK